MIEFEVPYPPSLNRHYRYVGRHVLLSFEGRAYRETVRSVLMAARVTRMTGPLRMRIELYPPDRRRRDVDNAMKSLCDSLQHGGAFIDDSQIKKLEVEMCEVVPGGKAIVRIDEYVGRGGDRE